MIEEYLSKLDWKILAGILFGIAGVLIVLFMLSVGGHSANKKIAVIKNFPTQAQDSFHLRVAETNPSDRSWTTYANTDYTIEYPKDWKTSISTNKGILETFEAVPINLSLDNFLELSIQKKQFSDADYSSLQKYFNDVKATQVPCTISPGCIKYKRTFTFQNHTFQKWILITRDKKNLYLLKYEYDNKLQSESVADNLVETFRSKD